MRYTDWIQKFLAAWENRDVNAIMQLIAKDCQSSLRQDIDGIFQISLNEEGLCTFFKQWRAVKES